mgnify:CR=1 FL=1
MRIRVGLAILNRNEEAALPVILPAIPRDAVELCFCVDGASTDRSRDILAAHAIDVLPEASAGRGEAFRLAFAHARGKVDALILFSADGNENPADIPRFRPCFESGADVVIASRMMRGAQNEEDGQTLKIRKWANLAFGRAAQLGFGRKQPFITDSINGFRGFTVAAWDRLAVPGNGYTVEYQSSIRAYKAGLRVVEFPTHEGQRIGGKSGAAGIPTGIAFLKVLAREYRK